MRFSTAPSIGFWKEESGQDLVEYALVFTFIALLAVTTLHGIALGVANVFARVSSTLASAS